MNDLPHKKTIWAVLFDGDNPENWRPFDDVKYTATQLIEQTCSNPRLLGVPSFLRQDIKLTVESVYSPLEQDKNQYFRMAVFVIDCVDKNVDRLRIKENLERVCRRIRMQENKDICAYVFGLQFFFVLGNEDDLHLDYFVDDLRKIVHSELGNEVLMRKTFVDKSSDFKRAVDFYLGDMYWPASRIKGL